MEFSGPELRQHIIAKRHQFDAAQFLLFFSFAVAPGFLEISLKLIRCEKGHRSQVSSHPLVIDPLRCLFFNHRFKVVEGRALVYSVKDQRLGGIVAWVKVRSNFRIEKTNRLIYNFRRAYFSFI